MINNNISAAAAAVSQSMQAKSIDVVDVDASEKQKKEYAFMKEYEEQDHLIEEGISLISNKITECLELLF